MSDEAVKRAIAQAREQAWERGEGVEIEGGALTAAQWDDVLDVIEGLEAESEEEAEILEELLGERRKKKLHDNPATFWKKFL